MLEVFRNHEKRAAEESSSAERSQHLPHRARNPLPRHPGRMVPPVPGSKVPLHHPPSVPMQLASNVMVVPPQQIAASSSQSFLSTNHIRKRFPLAVAHPIIRQNPNFNAGLAHGTPKALPQKVKEAQPGIPAASQDSPLDLTAPLDLSVKRKKDMDPADLFQQSASKKLKLLDSVKRREGQHTSAISGIMSKPPPIYPGLHRSEQQRLMRQQRKVHPMVQNPHETDSIQQKYFQHKASTSKESEEGKLRMARQAFAMQSTKMLHKPVQPKESQLPVKRAQAAVPPLVTSNTSTVWPPRGQAPPTLAQRLSEHERLLNEEKKKQLLARAAAMGIPVDQDPYQGLQRSPQLIKENGAVDSEMEEALRKMMLHSQHRQSPKSVTIEQQASSELKKRQAYAEYLNKQLILHNLQQQTQQLARLQEGPSTSTSPHVPPRRPSPHHDKQDILKRRYLYEMQTAYRPPSMSSSPPVLASEVDSKMKLVQGVGANSGPQYRLTLKDFDRQNQPTMHDKPKTDSKLLKTYHYRGPENKSKRVRDYLREYRKILGNRLEHIDTAQDSIRRPEERDGASQGSLGRRAEHVGVSSHCVTASRGPISQGLPHPISKLNGPAMTRPASTHQRRSPPLLTPVEPHGLSKRTASSPVRPGNSEMRYRASGLHSGLHSSGSGVHKESSAVRTGRKLLNPEEARNQILASMNPAFRGLFQDQDKQSQVMHSLKKNHSIRRSKGFSLNIKEVIAREISKCIDEDQPETSEVIDLTREPSEGSSTPEVSGRVGSPQTNLPVPVVIENLKQDMADTEPPPLIKGSYVKSGFVPLVSNSVISSGTVSSSQPFAASITKCDSPFNFVEEVPTGLFPQANSVSPLKVKRELNKHVVDKFKTCAGFSRQVVEGNRKDSVESTKREQEPKMEEVLKKVKNCEKIAKTGDFSCKQQVSEGVKVFDYVEYCKSRKELKSQRDFAKSTADLKCIEDVNNLNDLKHAEDVKCVNKYFTNEDKTDKQRPFEKVVENLKIDLPNKASEPSSMLESSSVTAAASIKSVSYDPRRKVLAALNEQQKCPPLGVTEVHDVKTQLEKDASLINYPDTKIVPRADQDDQDCRIPDQLLEDDDDDPSTDAIAATNIQVVPDEDMCVRPSTEPPEELIKEPVMEEQPVGSPEKPLAESPELADESSGVVEEMTPKPRRKRRRKVRRYYHIIPRRASARRGTKRKAPQTRRSPGAISKPKPESPPLQVRTRNFEGRRRLASYHRDTRYEQEIEKEQQKVMERRRRRRAVVVMSQGATSSESGSPDEGARRRRCKAVASYLSEIKKNVEGPVAAEVAENGYGVIGPHMELKVRIQRKNLTGRFQGNDTDSWEVVSEGDKPLTKSKACRAILQDGEWPSTSGVSQKQPKKRSKKRQKRRKNTDVRRRLLEARVLLDRSRPSIPPVPKELKRLAVNKKLGETLLHKAARLGHDEAALYCINYCSQDLNAKDNAGYTPLHECCVNGRLKVAKHMIAKGADVNGSAADGTRPVHDAIDNEKVELARLLLAHGGDPLIATYSGRTTRKLARSQETKFLIHGYLKDINGRILAPEEELDELQKLDLSIRFHASVQSTDDVVESGLDYMSGAPKSSADSEDESFLFELSDEPMLPSISMYLEEAKKYSNWLLLSDVIQRLTMTRADFMYSHRDVTIYTIKKEQLHSAALGQHHVKASMAKTAGKTLEFVELNDHIRRVLGTEVEFIS